MGIFPSMNLNLYQFGPLEVYFKTTYDTKTKKYISAFIVVDPSTSLSDMIYTNFMYITNIIHIFEDKRLYCYPRLV